MGSLEEDNLYTFYSLIYHAAKLMCYVTIFIGIMVILVIAFSISVIAPAPNIDIMELSEITITLQTSLGELENIDPAIDEINQIVGHDIIIRDGTHEENYYQQKIKFADSYDVVREKLENIQSVNLENVTILDEIDYYEPAVLLIFSSMFLLVGFGFIGITFWMKKEANKIKASYL